MTWFDVVAILIVVVIAWAESLRGFGRALYDLVGALIATKVALVLSAPLAKAAPVSDVSGPSEAFWLAVVFVILAILIVVATKFIYESTLLSLDVLDPVLGAIFGIASGTLAAHVFLRSLAVAYAHTEFGAVVMASFMGQELLELRSYRAVVASLQNIGDW